MIWYICTYLPVGWVPAEEKISQVLSRSSVTQAEFSQK
jgi:hypothetical protein